MSGIEALQSKLKTLSGKVADNSRLIHVAHQDEDGTFFILPGHPHYEDGTLAGCIMVTPEPCSAEEWERECLGAQVRDK